MAKLPIIIYPDPILRDEATPVERVDNEIRRLMDDMLETMYAAPGVGLAAPQIGVTRRLFVMDTARDDEPAKPRCLVNPEILQVGENSHVQEEGCLSIPKLFAEVSRPSSVLMRYIDREGQVHEEWFEGRPATVVQHELDHLNGVLFIDHLSRLKRDFLIRKFKKLRRDEETK